MSFINNSCHYSTEHQQKRSYHNHRPSRQVDTLFEGIVEPSEQAYNDLFLDSSTGIIDKESIVVTTTQQRFYDEERKEYIISQIHELKYKGETVWKLEPNNNNKMNINNDAATTKNRKQKYHSTCTLSNGTMEIVIESVLPSIASDEEVVDEIASAPTSIRGNTSNGSNKKATDDDDDDDGMALDHNTNDDTTVGIVFRESRKLKPETLIRSSAQCYQMQIAVMYEKEPTLVEYCVPYDEEMTINNDNEVVRRDNRDDVDQDDCNHYPNIADEDVKGLHHATSMTSEKSFDSSVYLNPTLRLERNDDELSTEQQEKLFFPTSAAAAMFDCY